MKTTLVIMAAGIGSRFGGGIKQLEAVGPNGEIIMDYAIYDARKAGFEKVIFIIRKELEQDFKKIIGDRIAGVMEVDYAFQELSALPGGYRVPEGRTKPWGTGQAVLSVKGKVSGPFLVINADDYYGPEGFRAIHEYMTGKMEPGAEIYDMCMAGFVLKNTLSENGAVTRGVSSVSEDGELTGVRETYGIQRRGGKLEAQDADGRPLSVGEDCCVSMNMWGLPPSFLEELERGFPEFLSENAEDLKSEYLLPSIIDRCIREGKGRVRVLPTSDKWFGVTYREDKPAVVEAIRRLIAEGVYPEKLYE